MEKLDNSHYISIHKSIDHKSIDLLQLWHKIANNKSPTIW